MSGKRDSSHRIGSFKNRVSVPSFLVKTYEMIENKEYDHIVCWSKDGNSFVIKNVNKFCQEVLPNYFKHNNFASFVRQLNMYDFHKIRNENNESEFRHKLFKRGAKNMLIEIRRKVNSESRAQQERNQDEESSQADYTEESQEEKSSQEKSKRETGEQSSEMQQIKSKQQNLESAIQVLIRQNEQLLQENKLLWEEIRKNKEKEEKKAEKLFTLMYCLMNQGNMLPGTGRPAITQGMAGMRGDQTPYSQEDVSDPLPTDLNGDKKGAVKKDWAAVTHIEKNGDKIPLCTLSFQKGKQKKKEQDKMQQMMRTMLSNIIGIDGGAQNGSGGGGSSGGAGVGGGLPNGTGGVSSGATEMDHVMRQYTGYFSSMLSGVPIKVPLQEGFQPTQGNVHKMLPQFSSRIVPSPIHLSGHNSPNGNGSQSPVLHAAANHLGNGAAFHALAHAHMKESPVNFMHNYIGNSSPMYTPNTPNLSPLLLRDCDDMGNPKMPPNESFQAYKDHQ